MIAEHLKFYVGGRWIDPAGAGTLDVVNPATDAVVARIAAGTAADVDRAVAAARAAFPSYSETSRESRIDLLSAVLEEYTRRQRDVADAIAAEIGAPDWISYDVQAAAGIAHLTVAIEVLRSYVFEEQRDGALLKREPIGVCALITPWNWPINQVMVKVAPALATGCTMVLKPSEVSPLSAILFTEILASAGVPAGVFNLINGDGPGVGAALAAHPDVDMVSFTGSTRAGIEVARLAAPTVKRVAQELGGKSPYVILEDADMEPAIAGCLSYLMMNSGQSCNAPSRILVPASRADEASQVARDFIAGVKVAEPAEPGSVGPVANRNQWNRIQNLLEQGIAEGATVVTGGPGLPEGVTAGRYVRPTIFADVRNDMTIAREEIFGPVAVIIPYADEEDAIRIANDTPYGLAGYVHGKDMTRVRRVGGRIRAGQISLNGAPLDFTLPFGGYKQSGNGREWGRHAFDEYVELKAMMGYAG